jgi:hypothetical protein
VETHKVGAMLLAIVVSHCSLPLGERTAPRGQGDRCVPADLRVPGGSQVVVALARGRGRKMAPGVGRGLAGASTPIWVPVQQK